MSESPEKPCASADCGAPKPVESPGATQLEPNVNGVQSTGRAEQFASFGALLSAFIASSGCWLPPLLILGGISGAGMTTFIEEYRAVFLTGTIAILLWAFYLTYRRRPAASGGRSKIMAFNKVMLWAATAMVVVFFFFPQTVTNLMASSDGFTADMERTVLIVEGMTGHTGTAKAEAALKTAPGVLAVKVDYETKQATIGTEKGSTVPKEKILEALESITYRGEFVDQAK